MSAAALILIIALAVIASVAIAIAWHFAAELERVTGEEPARARVREAEERLSALLRTFRRPAAPAPEAAPVPDHPRFGPLVSTPPEGIEVTRDDGVLSVRADLPVQRVLTEDHAPTCDFPAVSYAPPPPSWAEPPPSMAELRRQYDSWQETAYGQPGVTESVSAWREPAYGVDRCEADVDEAQRQAAGLLT
jgi:hypothetical protein